VNVGTQNETILKHKDNKIFLPLLTPGTGAGARVTADSAEFLESIVFDIFQMDTKLVNLLNLFIIKEKNEIHCDDTKIGPNGGIFEVREDPVGVIGLQVKSGKSLEGLINDYQTKEVLNKDNYSDRCGVPKGTKGPGSKVVRLSPTADTKYLLVQLKRNLVDIVTGVYSTTYDPVEISPMLTIGTKKFRPVGAVIHTPTPAHYRYARLSVDSGTKKTIVTQTLNDEDTPNGIDNKYGTYTLDNNATLILYVHDPTLLGGGGPGRRLAFRSRKHAEKESPKKGRTLKARKEPQSTAPASTPNPAQKVRRRLTARKARSQS
jgi:hypothetical protein